jgi:hypothetical protein
MVDDASILACTLCISTHLFSQTFCAFFLFAGSSTVYVSIPQSQALIIVSIELLQKDS